ncbi:MAG: hypothetical protein J7L71_00520 [Spirochaetaceae bacterium]|nr:hypothetical protein [Spirochaetaceae bacterium]
MGVIFLLSFVKNMESRRLRKKLGEGQILLSGFNVHYYGLESDDKLLFNSMGALGLSSEGLYYCSRILKKELFIKGEQFSSISVTDDFNGKNMYGNIVAFNFINVEGAHERAAFRIPYPEKWSKAITELFLSKNP